MAIEFLPVPESCSELKELIALCERDLLAFGSYAIGTDATGNRSHVPLTDLYASTDG
jgi:hypothetical protein